MSRDRFDVALEWLRNRQQPPLADTGLDSHNKRLVLDENRRRARDARITTDHPVFARLGFSRADFRRLQDAGCIELVPDVEQVVVDSEDVAVERRVELVRLTDRGRATFTFGAVAA